MQFRIEVIESREFLVAYDVNADSLEEACSEHLAYSDGATEVDCSRLDDSEEQIYIDKILDGEGNRCEVPPKDGQQAWAAKCRYKHAVQLLNEANQKWKELRYDPSYDYGNENGPVNGPDLIKFQREWIDRVRVLLKEIDE